MRFTSEDTQLYLPYWFVESYLSAFEAPGVSEDLFEHLRDQFLYRRLDAKLGNFLSVTVPRLQKLILGSNPGEPVEMSLQDLQGDLASALRSTEAKQNLIFSLGAIKLNLAEEQSVQSAPLFRREEILKKGSHGSLRLYPHKIAEAILLGYRNVADFSQVTHEGHSLDHFLIEPPLVVWKSLWLELSGVERLIYLILEKQMQWNCSMTHLAGSYRCDLSQLDWVFKRILSGRRKGSRAFQTLSFLKKIGKKFVEHGLLSSNTDQEVMLLDGKDLATGPQLLWTSSSKKNETLRDSLYSRKVAAKYIIGFISNGSLDLLCKCLGLSSNMITFEERQFLMDQAAELKIKPISVKKTTQTGQVFTSINAILLFVENYLRFHEDAKRYPPCQTVVDLVGDVFSDVDLTFQQKYIRFQQLVERNYTFQEVLAHEEDASVFLGKLRSEVCEFFMQRFSSEENPQEIYAKPQEPPVIAKTVQSLETQGVAMPKTDVFSRKDAMSLINDLATNYSSIYRELINQYLDSLDDASRKLILDVQARMQPLTFNEHLRQRLVRYLVAKEDIREEVEAKMARYEASQ